MYWTRLQFFHVLRTHLVVHANVSALQARPELLGTVNMSDSLYILFGWVSDRPMPVALVFETFAGSRHHRCLQLIQLLRWYSVIALVSTNLNDLNCLLSRSLIPTTELLPKVLRPALSFCFCTCFVPYPTKIKPAWDSQDRDCPEWIFARLIASSLRLLIDSGGRGC